MIYEGKPMTSSVDSQSLSQTPPAKAWTGTGNGLAYAMLLGNFPSSLKHELYSPDHR